MTVNFLNAVLIVSDEAERLAAWYRDVLGLPLKNEEHEGGEALHYGCYLHGLHIAIHPVENYEFASETGPGSVRIAFDVTDIDEVVTELEASDVDWVFRPVDLGWSTMLAIRDPDGNMVELLQMTSRQPDPQL